MKLNTVISNSKHSRARSTVFVTTVLIGIATVASCSGSSTNQPMAPGSAPASAAGMGSFQGAIIGSTGAAQAILTMDVWAANGRTGAQLTVSPNGSTAVISLNPGDRTFSVDLPAKSFGADQQVRVSGSWTGSGWTGEVSSTADSSSNPEKSNRFTLTPDLSTQSAVAIGLPSGTFTGALKFKASSNTVSKSIKGLRRVSLTLVPLKDLGDALASTLASRIPLNGYLKYDGAKPETLKNVSWNRETSVLSATTTTEDHGGTTAILCRLGEMSVTNKDLLQCSLTPTKSSQSAATGTLSQIHTVVAPPYPGPPVQPNPVPQPGPPPASTPYQPPAPLPAPAPTAAPIPAPTAIPVPVPTPSFIVRQATDFAGSAVFTSELGVRQSRTLRLTITLNSEPTGAPQPAKVKFIVDGSRVGANFVDGTFNSASGELEAKEMLVLGALAGRLELKCGGVSLANRQYDFLCNYESSVTNVTGQFHFKGNQR